MESKKIEIDERKLNRLKIIIIGMIRDNLKTKQYTKSQMSNMILQKIEMEVLD